MTTAIYAKVDRDGAAQLACRGRGHAMSALRRALDDYLTVRRELGYKLERHEQLLAHFLAYLDGVGPHTITTDGAVAWATSARKAPTRAGGRSGCRWCGRSPRYLHAIDPAPEVPPADLLPARPPSRERPTCIPTPTSPR